MVRRDIEKLIARLALIPGVEDLAMTTNAHFLRGRAQGPERGRSPAYDGQPRFAGRGGSLCSYGKK